MGKVEQNKKLKKETLLSSAYDLFLSKGPENTSISEICEKAGVAKGTFYLYYRNKKDIEQELIIKHSEAIIISVLKKLQNENVTEFSDKIIYIANSIINYLNDNREFLKFIDKNLSKGLFSKVLDNTLIKNSDETIFDYKGIYYDMIEESGYRFNDPDMLLYLVVELVGSTVNTSVLYNVPCDIETIKPHLFSAIKAIIESQKEI